MLEKNKKFGLVLNEGETQKLKELCERYKIPITYPELFDEEKSRQSLWAFDYQGIGLVGTQIMRYFSQNNIKIFHGIGELEEYLSNI